MYYMYNVLYERSDNSEINKVESCTHLTAAAADMYVLSAFKLRLLPAE